MIYLVSVNQLLTVANSAFNFTIYLSFCMRTKKKSGEFRFVFVFRTAKPGADQAYPEWTLISTAAQKIGSRRKQNCRYYYIFGCLE